MPKPFPGMDPYLEGYLWSDVHQRLATEISDQLTPHISPRYVARLAITIIKDETPDSEIGIMYPDVELITSTRSTTPNIPPGLLPAGSSAGGGVLVMEPMTITKPLTVPRPEFKVRVVTVEIRDVAHNRLVTSIELLSPVNKREPGLTKYREKQKSLYENGVHLLELDLLRRGKRAFTFHKVPKTPYRVTLMRANANFVNVWPIKLADKLPTVAVPLRKPDPDVPLDLSEALASIYNKARYDLSIDYTMPPPSPSLSSEQETWLEQVLRDAAQTH